MKTKISDFDSVRDVPKRFCLLSQFQVPHICWWFLNLNCWPSPFLLATGMCLASLASLPGTSHSGCQKTSYFLSPKACCLLLLLYHLFSLLLVASSHQPFGFQLDARDCPGLLCLPHPLTLAHIQCPSVLPPSPPGPRSHFLTSCPYRKGCSVNTVRWIVFSNKMKDVHSLSIYYFSVKFDRFHARFYVT